MDKFAQILVTYRKVTSSKTSHFKAHAVVFRLSMKGIFDAYCDLLAKTLDRPKKYQAFMLPCYCATDRGYRRSFFSILKRLGLLAGDYYVPSKRKKTQWN